MRPQFPAGPANRLALYWLGLLASLKALSLVLMAQAVASMLAGLVSHSPAWADQLGWGLAGVALRSLTVWAQGVASRRAALGVKEELRAALLARALRNGTRAAGPSDGGLAILATRGLDALDSYYTQFLPALVNCAAIPLLLGARILLADWVSAVVVVLTVPLVPLFMVLIGRYTEDRVRAAQSALARLSGHMLELAKGLPVLVGLGRATAQRKALEDISEQYRSKTMDTLRTAFLSALALELIATISVAVVAVFIGVRLVHGDMALEAGLLALILAPDCYLPLRELGTAHHASDDGRAALAEVTAVMDAPEVQRLRPQDGSLPGGEASDDGADLPAVTARNLMVAYGGRLAPAVGPLSFDAPAGLITALDGASGAGKSTILGVLAGIVGTGGGTTVSGTIAGFSPSDVAWVPQHPVMLAKSVLAEVQLYLADGAANGAAATATATAPAATATAAAAAQRCLEAAGAGHLAGKHPAELSPGELRRVALARGLARIEAGATLLLLDEPTAHLDRESANVVNESILKLRGRATVLLVAHDRLTRELADHVVAVAAGTQAGPAAELAAAPTAARAAAALAAPAKASADATEEATAAGTAARAAAGTLAGDAARDGAGDGGLVPAQTGVNTPARIFRLLRPELVKFGSAGVVGVLAALFAVALAGLSGWLIIRASEQPPILYLLTAIVGVRFFGIGRAVLRYTERLLLHDAVFSSLTRLRGRLWDSLSRGALSLRRLLQGGNVLGTVIDDVDTVRDLLPRVVLPPVTAVAVGTCAVAATALLLPVALPAVIAAAVVSLAAAPAAALLADRMSAQAEQRLRSGVLRDVAAALDARAELHANGVAGPVLSAIGESDKEATVASQRSAWAEGLGQALTVLACGAAALATAVLAGPQVMDGSVAPATAAVVVLMQLALVDPYAAMTTAVRQYPALRLVLDRISEAGVLDASDAQDDGIAGPRAGDTRGRQGGGLEPVAPRAGALAGLELDALSAAWPSGPDVFTGVSATAVPGRWLAVTGASGSGKSTLLAVMLGFLPPHAGRIAVSGRAAWCPQEAHLFDSTIRGNLLLGRPEGKAGDAEQEMADALAAVGLEPLLRRLEHGSETRIGPGGAFLSGGERQRLAVARTLMTGADVILLDEPTAHLDAEAGREMLADLRQGLAGRTVVLVTHNPDDIDPADERLDLDAAAGTAAGAGNGAGFAAPSPGATGAGAVLARGVAGS
ncbi:thiol reductant ABC exporter subunit CydD [Arthrobacter oryzae]|uniref:thiol reductant ABC exporter subunit CydD n=1 Tax=Arthrobacter oryzae TaxID=409290 RepID=UPI00273C64C4|nr:thiol reductant ABC exporter subunit CydD [Arthrobacter oryzae]WLQ05590.1 thiol reductant ABC exporter subunit CydD [Arthrobacter oryzae]